MCGASSCNCKDENFKTFGNSASLFILGSGGATLDRLAARPFAPQTLAFRTACDGPKGLGCGGLRRTGAAADEFRFLRAEQNGGKFGAILQLGFHRRAAFAIASPEFPDRILDIAAQVIGDILERRPLRTHHRD